MTQIPEIGHAKILPAQVPTPSKDPEHKYFRRGDLVRVSEWGMEKSKRLKDRHGYLGRIVKCTATDDNSLPTSFQYDVEWILGGRLNSCSHEDLVYRTADEEGMTDSAESRRRKRKPVDFMEDVAKMEDAKKKFRQQQQEKQQQRKVNLTAVKKSEVSLENLKMAKKSEIKIQKNKPVNKSLAAKEKGEIGGVKRNSLLGNLKLSNSNTKRKKESKVELVAPVDDSLNSTSFDLYERHLRDFNRIFSRLKEKVDVYRHLWAGEEEVPSEFDEQYDEESDCKECDHSVDNLSASQISKLNMKPQHDNSKADDTAVLSANVPNGKSNGDRIAKSFPSHPPFNWEMIDRRFDKGRYTLDRQQFAEEERLRLFEPHSTIVGTDQGVKKDTGANSLHDVTSKKQISVPKKEIRLAYPIGVNWDLFRSDVFRMCDAALDRADLEDDCGQRGSLTNTIKKIKEAVEQACERTGNRHVLEMSIADDRHKFSLAIESYENKEAAMQSWRQEPFPERRYDRVDSDAVCSGLSKVDERIARYELRTSLPDSFIGQSYHYNDTSLSEVWMKSVVDETETIRGNKKGGSVDKKREAALAITADEGVTRAQVSATIQSLLVAVQDRVMTDNKVLQQRELKSANSFSDNVMKDVNVQPSLLDSSASEHNENDRNPLQREHIPAFSPEIVEQPVWGIDCYTRRNICVCLELDFDREIALSFIEKWLLPAINACPEHLAHNIGNAARILEGLPFDYGSSLEVDQDNSAMIDHPTMDEWSRNLVASALLRKLVSFAPLWLKAAANQLRRARQALGPNFFRVHPKGHGSVLLSPKVQANSLVTFYHGELYPSWRWGEKMDAIEITQKRKDLKPALPDFYNMALERPQKDPRGYSLLFVDASRKAGLGSSLSHSCVPTCEVRVAAVNGELCLAMTTLRELEMGEELTFDYNAVTESLNEYRSAVCLCGYGKCRGSFLHFATADCYQQILARNSPVASRFASLVKGSMKKVMADEDEKVLRCHGFQTAAFGAISVNRRQVSENGRGKAMVDSLQMVPIWLRTYVADILRYIEYERRALPIALICDNRAANEKEDPVELDLQPSKEPKREPSFFFFSRTQRDLIHAMLEKEGLPSTLVGLQRKHAMQRVASAYWQDLDVVKKEFWKDQARLHYTKKLNVWRTSQKASNTNVSASEKTKGKSKPGISDLLHSSKISFQDADAEGISAMEQRIQQITQTLSRIGRVLDRHREQSFLENPLIFDQGNIDLCESMRNRVHQPLVVLSELDIVGWMWNSRDGIVKSLIRGVESSKCVRHPLLEILIGIKSKYDMLENCGDPTITFNAEKSWGGSEIKCARSHLNSALLEMRNAIINELKEMAETFKKFKPRRSPVNVSLTSSGNNSEVPERQQNVEIDQFACRTENVSNPICVSFESTCSDVPDALGELTSSSGQRISENSTLGIESTSLDEKSICTEISLAKCNVQNVELDSWMLSYGERFTLESSADLLLLYACTSNFFIMKPYKELESTPVDVYARELGNSVPQSAIDKEIENQVLETVVVQENGTIKSKTGPSTSSSFNERNAKGFSGKSVKDSQMCNPADIVAKVTVQYQGDYVLSQLLQWYNAGIGQKPGIPDMLGCTLLPSMNGCWNSELLASNKVSSGKKTIYETKIRPRLVEWIQDQNERGNPWPSEIRQAFEALGEGDERAKNVSNVFLPFGSPVIDFLVTGDESNIEKVLEEIDIGAKVTTKLTSDGLLSSVDKGRPAQAVSTWVQCEKCLKWRKIPWHVDADMLPEKFYCEDNKWNPDANSCDAPEDEWDASDALVGADGKVEGSPVKKAIKSEVFSILDEKCFTIGARFDVRRGNKGKFTIGTVTKVDFSGLQKRVKFHFSKTSIDRDEWIPLGSDSIAPLYSMVSIQITKKDKTGGNGTDKFSVLDEGNFTIGARFNVRRSDKDHFSNATVTHVDFGGHPKRIKFHFAKSSTCRDEWVDFGSDRIAPLNSNGFSLNEKKDQQITQKIVSKKKTTNTGKSEVFENSVLTKKSNDEKKSKTMAQSAIIDNTKSNKNILKTQCLPDGKSHGQQDIRHKSLHIEMPSSGLDHPEEECFPVGARFDVQRRNKSKYYVAVVKEVDYTGPTKRVLFHFPKTHVKFDEWIDVTSPSICPLYSKVSRHQAKANDNPTSTLSEDVNMKSNLSEEATEHIPNFVPAAHNFVLKTDAQVAIVDDQVDCNSHPSRGYEDSVHKKSYSEQGLSNIHPDEVTQMSPNVDSKLSTKYEQSCSEVEEKSFYGGLTPSQPVAQFQSNVVTSEDTNVNNFQPSEPFGSPNTFAFSTQNFDRSLDRDVSVGERNRIDDISQAKLPGEQIFSQTGTSFDKLLLLASASHGYLDVSLVDQVHSSDFPRPQYIDPQRQSQAVLLSHISPHQTMSQDHECYRQKVDIGFSNQNDYNNQQSGSNS